MSFIQFPNPTPIFPELSVLTWSVFRTPTYSGSNSITAVTGREVQHAREVYPRFSFKLSYGNDSWLRDQTQNIIPDLRRAMETELEQISGLFLQCLGSYGEFYYDDPEDDYRDNSPVGTGDGNTTIFQTYIDIGTGPFTPAFYVPVTGIKTLDVVYENGIAISNSLYHIDTSNTKIVFNSPPANGVIITADLSFYYRSHFLIDMQEYEQWAKNLWEYKVCEFLTVKP